MASKIFFALSLLALGSVVTSRSIPGADSATDATKRANDVKVLILGGGIAGVIAARTLHEQGIDDFMLVEAQDQLGGRLKSITFGAPGKEVVLELGANWIQGTQDGDGPPNPILTLAQKHGLHTVYNDWDDIKTYDHTGAVDYLDVFNQSVDAYTDLTVSAGARVAKKLVDGTARTGYSLGGAKSRTAHAAASEYYQFDWEYAQTPEESSWIASSWGNNFTYNTFGDDNLMSIDQRGFKEYIQAEADDFLDPSQLALNALVQNISYSNSGVSVVLADGETLTADYALCTFSLGVLQHDDVRFVPELPQWKEEAIQSMTMATYSKIFLQFPKKFWADNEMALYADTERGRYPVWQSLDHAKFFLGSGIFFVTVTGDFSQRIEALSDTEVQAEVMGVVRNMFPDVDVPEPLAFHYNRWFSDPLFRGSYSNWPSSFFSEHHENLRATVDDRLWFAGEATSQKFFGFMHGAYYEGLEVATSMAKCIKGGGCVTLNHVEDVTNAHPYWI